FEQQVAQSPNNVAVVFEGEQLTYQQLNDKANQLAHYLREMHGVKPDTLVGLCVERSLEMVIGIFGILKAGGAYVPLDPSYPQERLAYMLEDAALDVVLSQNQVCTVLSEFNGSLLLLDGMGSESKHFCHRYSTASLPQNALTVSNLAYVIYTSGSTGKPKGVMVEHQALMNRIYWMQQQYQLTHEDSVLQKTPFSFDVSVWEFVWPMMAGASIVMAKPEGHKDAQYLAALINKEKVTTLHFVPSMFNAYLDGVQKDSPSVRQIFCSGEALDCKAVYDYVTRFSQAKLHNLYGPTEAAIDVTAYDCAGLNSSSVPIGAPIANTQIYILDPYNNPVAMGVPGELHIAGDGLARGYLNRPELTEEKFIINRFAPNTRMYKSGDLARWSNDGNIEYLGRIDSQVKIRGFRIELGEIENQLVKSELVDSALVMAKEVGGCQQLLGYVKPSMLISHAEYAEYVSTVKSELNQYLPEFMVPSFLVVVEDWPVTPNGKVDRKALPIPDGSALQGAYEAPSTN
ncbi:non-ribosomal peptide synthetase, partial [Pseudoalteromonas luteoviolacea]